MKSTIIFFIFFKLIFSYLTFPFKKKNEIEASSKYLIYNDLIVNLFIGSPEQEIKSIIQMNKRELFIPNILVNGNYNENKSNSYFNLQFNWFLDYNGKQYNAKKSKEKIILSCKLCENDKMIKNNFSFYLVNEQKENESLNFGLIGLQSVEKKDEFNFWNQINEKKIISYNFIKENIGEVNLGIYPHEINKKLDKETIKTIKTSFALYDFMIEFSNISYGNKSDFEKRVVFPNNIKGIIASKNYQEYINQTFFNDLFKTKKCFSEILNDTQEYYNKLMIYYCDKDIDIKNFESIKFYSKEANFTFILDYKDLFQLYNNKFVFLSFFHSSYSIWKLGEIFQKKYKMYLDIDNKVFGFYINYINNNYVNLYVVVIFVLITIIFLLSFFLYFTIVKKPRKIRANELDDNYEYIQTINV